MTSQLDPIGIQWGGGMCMHLHMAVTRHSSPYRESDLLDQHQALAALPCSTLPLSFLRVLVWRQTLNFMHLQHSVRQCMIPRTWINMEPRPHLCT